jgi:predicted deacetylase
LPSPPSPSILSSAIGLRKNERASTGHQHSRCLARDPRFRDLYPLGARPHRHPAHPLLVVPDYHHRGNITLDREFCAWLGALAAAGHEPVLHGYFHQRDRKPSESSRTRFFTRVYTADEGEFFDLTFDQARDLMTYGREELALCAGVPPTGFIAPAWLLSADAKAAATSLGFAYTTYLGSVSDLATGRHYKSQSLCWSVRGRRRRVASLCWNALLFQLVRKNPLFRLSIHPPDLTHPKVWYQIQHLACRALEGREAMTYHDFVIRRRPASTAS